MSFSNRKWYISILFLGIIAFGYSQVDSIVVEAPEVELEYVEDSTIVEDAVPVEYIDDNYDYYEETFGVPYNDETAPIYDKNWYNDYSINTGENPQNYPIQSRKMDNPLNDTYDGSEFEYKTSVTPKNTSNTQTSSNTRSNNFNFWNWLYKKISDLFGFIYEHWKIFIIILVIFLLLLLVNNVFFDGKGFSRLFSRKSKKKKLKTNIEELAEEEPEDITEYNFSVMSQKAFEKENYRLAFRFLFLKLLQDLDEQKIIYWKKNKTNQDYISEIKNETIRSEYKDLANYFDYVWYGKHEVSQQEFEKSQKEYRDIENMIAN